MDVYPTAHPKYVKDSEYDILKTLHTTYTNEAIE